MASYWLLKTEPGTYSFDDLQKEKKTVWDGVRNPVALKNIGAMKKGDSVFVYHTGSEKAVVGIAEVTGNPYPDPSAGDPRVVVVEIKAQSKLSKPVLLSDIKADQGFKGFELVRLPRLSVMPVTAQHWKKIISMAK